MTPKDVARAPKAQLLSKKFHLSFLIITCLTFGLMFPVWVATWVFHTVVIFLPNVWWRRRYLRRVSTRKHTRQYRPVKSADFA